MPVERHVEGFRDQVAVLAGLDVGALWDRMLGEFLDAFVRFDRQGLDGDELAREVQGHVDGLSVKFEEDLARKSSSVAYNQGRAAEIATQAVAAGVQFVVRSEVLDTNTCPTCAQLDGSVVAVTDPDYQRLMPPALCEGGDRCRGFYIPISGGLT